MKRLLLIGAVAGVAMGANAQIFKEGDKKIDFTIGVGTIDYTDKNRATFDQHFTMEWGVAEFGDGFTVGAGFAVNNMYGGMFEGSDTGSYDYSYRLSDYGTVIDPATGLQTSYDNSRNEQRQGTGWAECHVAREDVDFLGIVSLHYSPMEKLDTYARLGLGFGVMNYIYSNYHNQQNFDSADFYEHNVTGTSDSYIKYSYNDLDHVRWDKSLGAKVVPSFSLYLGATYYLTDNWGADLQLGLINANFRGRQQGYPNSYGVFAVGVSYLF